MTAHVYWKYWSSKEMKKFTRLPRTFSVSKTQDFRLQFILFHHFTISVSRLYTRQSWDPHSFNQVLKCYHSMILSGWHERDWLWLSWILNKLKHNGQSRATLKCNENSKVPPSFLDPVFKYLIWIWGSSDYVWWIILIHIIPLFAIWNFISLK